MFCLCNDCFKVFHHIVWMYAVLMTVCVVICFSGQEYFIVCLCYAYSCKMHTKQQGLCIWLRYSSLPPFTKTSSGYLNPLFKHKPCSTHFLCDMVKYGIVAVWQHVRNRLPTSSSVIRWFVCIFNSLYSGSWWCVYHIWPDLITRFMADICVMLYYLHLYFLTCMPQGENVILGIKV